MRVRSVYTLKSFASLDEALAYARKIESGSGVHSESEIEIEWDKKAKKLAPLKNPGMSATGILSNLPGSPSEDAPEEGLQWKVVVVNEDGIPGGSICAECSSTHFENDYLCGDCRAAL